MPLHALHDAYMWFHMCWDDVHRCCVSAASASVICMALPGMACRCWVQLLATNNNMQCTDHVQAGPFCHDADNKLHVDSRLHRIFTRRTSGILHTSHSCRV